MNVILFTSADNTSGGSRQALYLAQGLAERGHKVLFFVPERSALPALAPDKDFWRFLCEAKTWRRSLESAMPTGNGPCVVHAFHNAAVKRLAWWGLFWKKRAATAAHRGVIFRPNNPLPYWSPGIDRFLVNSEACGRVLRGIGLSARRIAYVPNAVPDSRLVPGITSEELRSSLCIPPDAPIFLSIGGNKPYKGIRELILAFADAFPERGVREPHLVIVGVAPHLWEPLAAEGGISRRIHCLGKTEDVASYLRAATVFVLPSLSESMPNTLLEAVRAGLPCIGTSVGAVPDILNGTNTACGLVVPPGDIPALTVSLRRMLAEPGLREALAAGAVSEGEGYKPEVRINLIEGIYMELLRNKGLL